MDRDCNIENLSYRTTDGGTVIRLSDLQDWMTDKKIVKKGLHPHPYADVLHEWVEGAEIEFESYHGGLLCFTKEIASTSMLNCKSYRIKPSEPVCEYLWYTNNGNTNWMTIEEAKMTKIEWYCATETKRVRQ